MWSGLKSLAVAAVAVTAAYSSAEARELPEILESGVIRIGVPESFPPFGSVGA